MAIAFTQLQLLQLLVWIVIKALFQIVIMLPNDNHNRIDQTEPRWTNQKRGYDSKFPFNYNVWSGTLT